MLTSATIGRLIDQGKLTLDTSVAQAVPAMATRPARPASRSATCSATASAMANISSSTASIR
jgi:CubicO group peptidase (beta-lactamase class C family)